MEKHEGQSGFNKGTSVTDRAAWGHGWHGILGWSCSGTGCVQALDHLQLTCLSQHDYQSQIKVSWSRSRCPVGYAEHHVSLPGWLSICLLQQVAFHHFSAASHKVHERTDKVEALPPSITAREELVPACLHQWPIRGQTHASAGNAPVSMVILGAIQVVVVVARGRGAAEALLVEQLNVPDQGWQQVWCGMFCMTRGSLQALWHAGTSFEALRQA